MLVLDRLVLVEHCDSNYCIARYPRLVVGDDVYILDSLRYQYSNFILETEIQKRKYIRFVEMGFRAQDRDGTLLYNRERVFIRDSNIHF